MLNEIVVRLWSRELFWCIYKLFKLHYNIIILSYRYCLLVLLWCICVLFVLYVYCVYLYLSFFVYCDFDVILVALAIFRAARCPAALLRRFLYVYLFCSLPEDNLVDSWSQFFYNNNTIITIMAADMGVQKEEVQQRGTNTLMRTVKKIQH